MILISKKLFFLDVIFKNSLEYMAVKTAVLVLYGAFFLSSLCITPVFAVLTETPSPSDRGAEELIIAEELVEEPMDVDESVEEPMIVEKSMCTLCSTVISSLCFCGCRSIVIKKVFFALVANFMAEWNLEQEGKGKKTCVIFGSAGIKIHDGDFDFSDLNDIDVLVEDEETATSLLDFVNKEIQGVMYSLLGGSNEKGWISFDIKDRSVDSSGSSGASGKVFLDKAPKVKTIILKENDINLCAFEVVIKSDWMSEDLDYYQMDFDFPENLVIDNKERVSLNLLTEKSYMLLDQMTLDMEIKALVASNNCVGDATAADLDPAPLMYICKTLCKVKSHQDFYDKNIIAFEESSQPDSGKHLFIAEEDVEHFNDKFNKLLRELNKCDGFLGFIHKELFSFNFSSIAYEKYKSIDDDNQGGPEAENLRKIKLALSKWFLIEEEASVEGKGLFDFFCQSATSDNISKIILFNIHMHIKLPEIDRWKSYNFVGARKSISTDNLDEFSGSWYRCVERILFCKFGFLTENFNYYMKKLTELKNLAGLPCFICNSFCDHCSALDSSKCNNNFVSKICPIVLGAGLSIVVFFPGADKKDMHFVVIDYNSIKNAGFNSLIEEVENCAVDKSIIKKHPDSCESIIFFFII